MNTIQIDTLRNISKLSKLYTGKSASVDITISNPENYDNEIIGYKLWIDGIANESFFNLEDIIKFIPTIANANIVKNATKTFSRDATMPQYKERYSYYDFSIFPDGFGYAFCIYDIFEKNRLIVESDEWYNTQEEAKLAAKARIDLLENGE